MSETQIPSVLQNALRVLEAIGESGPVGADAAAIESLTGLHRRSIYRHISSLKALGMVSEATQPAHYRLGPSIAALAQNASDQREFLRRARLFCAELSERTLEPVHVTVLDQGTAVTVASASPDTEIASKSPPIILGSRRPLHASASGKVYLAFNPSAFDAYRVHTLESFTPFTITTMEQLSAECLEVRERGYALDRQELLLGVSCVAVPVHGISGRAVGTLALSTKKPVMSAARRRELLGALQPAALQFTQAIGGNAP